MSLGDLENAYFAEKDRERRQALREKLEAAAKDKAIAEALHTDDDVLADRIRVLGFDGDSARVFDLLPLIHVSWADGKIQEDERALIFAVLEKRGIALGSEACHMVEMLLEKRPSDTYLEESLHVLRALKKKQGDSGDDIVALSEAVAHASGGLLGLGSVSKPERDLLQHIADVLGKDAQDEFHKGLA